MSAPTGGHAPRLSALLMAVVLGLAGCIGAMQTQATDVVGAGGLVPTVEDKDVGLVGLRQGFDVKTYTVLAVEKLPVAPEVINDDEDRKVAAAMPSYFQSEMVRRIREANLFARVVNLSETSFTAGTERALRLQGKIAQLDPGSRALRYFVGFGLGGARPRPSSNSWTFSPERWSWSSPTAAWPPTESSEETARSTFRSPSGTWLAILPDF